MSFCEFRKLRWSLAVVVLMLAFGGVNAANVTVSWDANTESDLAGYNVYIGESTGNYTGVVDVGNATEFTWNNLNAGNTYYFAVTAYDFAGNESNFSDEVNAILPDNGGGNPPELIDVVIRGDTQLDVIFSEDLEKGSAETANNYSISNGVSVLGAVLDNDPKVVHLITTTHQPGRTYVLSISNVRDLDGNAIASGSSRSYELNGGSDDTTPPQLTNVTVLDLTHIDAVFNERLDSNSAEDRSNYQINNGVQVLQARVSSDGRQVQLTTTPHQGGTTYSLQVSNVRDEAGNTISGNSSASYETPAIGDNEPPALVSVSVNGVTQIDVTFNEPVEKTSAETKVNYSISGNVQVLGAILDENLTTVHLITSTHGEGQSYTLTVSNVKDRAANANAIAASQLTYDMSAETPPDGGDNIGNQQTFALYQNYPNPFNPETEIKFFLEKQRTIELKVYNPLGQLVKSLVKENLPAGFHTVVWDGTNNNNLQVPSGVYIYSLEIKREAQKGDMLVNVSLERRVRTMTLIR